MNARIRALERKLTRERATLAVHDFVDAVSAQWDDLLEHPDGPEVVIDLVQFHWNRGIGLPTLPRAINFLQEHLARRKPLDQRSLISIMAPWSVKRPDNW